MFAALKDENPAKFCSFTDKPDQCLSAMAMAKAFMGSGNIAQFVSDSDFKAISSDIDASRIQVSANGKRATVHETCKFAFSDCEPSTDKWVNVDGDWKLVFDLNS